MKSCNFAPYKTNSISINMKKILLTLVIAIVSLTASAQTPQDILKIIDASWQSQIPANSPLLKKYGLKVLVSDVDEPEDEPGFYTFVYGRGVKMKKVKHDEGEGIVYYEDVPVAVSSNAFAVRLELSTDNAEYVYFKNKTSWQTFIKYLKNKTTLYVKSKYDPASKMYLVYIHF